MQRKLTYHLGKKEQKLDKQLIRELKKLANKHSIQYALLWYIYLFGEAALTKLYRIYRYLSEKTIRENTVRKQLEQLQRKGLIKRIGDKYYSLVDPREVEDLFDRERSRAGKIGATLRHMKIKNKSMKISPGLSYYTKKVIDEAQKLIRKGKKAVALDLISHTLLPLRENAVLWLWHGDLFAYYEPKTRQRWRVIESKEISNLLKKLGFTEGIMILHTLGHNEVSKIIKKMFSRGSYSWPWARSISYGLKQLGLLHEIDDLFRIQLKKLNNRIELTLWNLYSKQLLANYTINWKHETPEPLKNKHYIIATVLGKQHVKKEIEENSYFSKWRI